MRRGLMEWNPEELPVGLLEDRIARLRTAMKAARLDAFIAYTNIARPSAVTWLTGFTPYWSEGLLLVPMSGRLVFATALSNRVADWIRSTNPVSEVTSTPKPGALLGERLAKHPSVKRVGILEIDTLPSGLYDDLAASAPAVELTDAGATFASLRSVIDANEQRMIARADALARAALDQLDVAKATDAGGLAGLIEKHARLAGAEEAYIHVAPDLVADRRLIRTSRPTTLADRFAVRASVAYKGSWVRRTRTFAKDRPTAKADAWFADLVSSLEPGKPYAAQLAARVKALPGAQIRSWIAESCTGSYPLAVVASSKSSGKDASLGWTGKDPSLSSTGKDTPQAGSLVVLTLELSIDGAPWLGAAPLIVGRTTL
jgi:hypothetical protein